MPKSTQHALFSSSILVSSGTIISMLFHFASIAILTRHLAQAELGFFVLVLVAANFFMILAGLGLDLTLVKIVSERTTGDTRGALARILTLRTASLALFSTISYFTSPTFSALFGGSIGNYSHYVPILCIILSYRELLFNLLQGLHMFGHYATVQIASAALRVFCIVGTIQAGIFTLDALLIIEITAAFITVLLIIVMLPLRALLQTDKTQTTYGKIFRFSVPIHLNNILTFCYDRISVVLVGSLLNPASVALYDVAAKIPDAMHRVFASFIVVYFPNLSRLFARGQTAEAVLTLNRVLKLFAALLCIGTLITFLFREEIMVLVFSAQYREASWTFVVLVFGFGLRALANLMGYTIVSAGYSAVPAKVNVVSNIICITGSALLIPRFGYVGAAYSLIAMNCVAQFLYFQVLARKSIPVSPAYLKPYLLLLVTTALIWAADIEHPLARILLILLFTAVHWPLFQDELELFTPSFLKRDT